MTETGCWNWISSKDSRGYGQLSVNGRLILAHRYSYIFHKGKIADDLEIDHLCRNIGCVNPDHLEAVTHRENILRGDTLPAINARKEFCKWGHSLSDCYHYTKGGRKCRKCAQQHYLEQGKLLYDKFKKELSNGPNI